MNNFFKAISVVFHPLLMPLIGTYILLSHTLLSVFSHNTARILYLVVATSTIGLPMLMLPFLYYRKKIKSLEMSERQERFFPLFIISFFYFFSCYTLRNIQAPEIISSFISGCFIATVTAAIINIWWKISLHAIGMGGITGLLVIITVLKFCYPENLIFQAILYSGIVATARLWLNTHNLLQIVAGYVLGYIIITVSILYL